MADLAHLGGLKEVQPLDLSNYADVKERTFQLPKKGRYTLRAPDSFPSTAFGRTKKGEGVLSVQIDPVIVGPEHEGLTVRFTRISATTWKRDGLIVSQIGDYLRACGFNGSLDTEQEQADAVESTAGQSFEGRLDWKVYNSRTGFSLEGMEKFPKLADGSYQSWVEDPADYELDEVGNIKTGADGNKVHKRLRANLFVRDYLPAVA